MKTMRKYLHITLCFKEGTFRGLDIANMIRRGVGIDPYRIYAYNIYHLNKRFEEKDLEVIDQEGYGVTLVLYQSKEKKYNQDRRQFMVAELGNVEIENTQVLYWIIQPDQLDVLQLFHELLDHPNLTVAYCCDEEDEYFQNASSPSDYRVRGKSYAHLEVVYDDYWAEEKIDISHNPGRKTLVSGMWLMSCWRMWFGQGFLARVPAERLLTFPYAHRAEQLPSGKVFIELYADPFAAARLENRTVQQAFRDWVGMEEMG